MTSIISIDPATAAVTLLMAVGLIGLGWFQLGALKGQIKTLIERSYANLLPSIDERYETKEMQESRNIEQKLLDKAKTACSSLTGKTKEQKLRSSFLKYVADLRDKNHHDYLVLMRKLNFFETVGYLCKKKYLSYEDIIELYGMPVTRSYLLLLPHIQDRQSKEGPKVYECFIELGQMTVDKYPDYDITRSTS